VKGLLPELWHADSGEIEKLAQWKEADGRTLVPLNLDFFGSMFVVFRKSSERVDRVLEVARNGKRDEQARVGFDSEGRLKLRTFESGRYWAKTAKGKVVEWTVTNLLPAMEFTGSWEVEFGNGNHEWTRMNTNGKNRVTFERMVSWTERKETRYFSGTAVYRKKFTLPGNYLGEKRRIFVDLGDVRFRECVVDRQRVEMKHVVETVTILVTDIVGKRVTNKDAVPLHIALTAFALTDGDFKVRRNSFLCFKGVVKRR